MIMAIGQELLDIPFADLVRNLAFAIAEGQLALDRSSVETLEFLLANNVNIVPEITEIIEPVERQVNMGGGKKIAYTGANIRASGVPPITLNLLQAGLQPTFYQFTEATIEVKLSISIKRTEESGNPQGSSRVPVKGVALRAFASPVNYRTSNTYSYTAQGSSVLRATLKPVPPPPRLTPRTVTVNALVSPPVVTITD
jgi:hypothetical protein